MNPLIYADDDHGLPRVVEEILEVGGILIFPTDTVFGIGGNPWDERALASVQAMKGCGPDRPFTLHLSTLTSIERFVYLDDRMRTALERCLPGPYTFLLQASEEAPRSATKEGKVGVRVPDHPFFTKVMARIARPLFGTSVNRTGESPLQNIDEMIERFGGVDLIVTGTIGRGTSSAIIDLTVSPPQALRGELPEGLL